MSPVIDSVAVSVIMPVYNAKDYVGRAIESILSQDFESFELILVDDGSTDGSADICDEFARKDDRIVLIRQKNAGTCAARNVGLSIARGEYITFCDHDDEYLPGSLQSSYDKVKKENADVLKNSFLIVENNETESRTYKVASSEMKYEASDLRDHYCDIRCNPLFKFVWNALYRRDVIGSLNFDLIYKHGLEDNVFNMRILENVKTCVVFSPNVAYQQIIRKNSSSQSFLKKLDKNNFEEYQTYFNTEYNFLIRFQQDCCNLRNEFLLLDNMYRLFCRSDWSSSYANELRLNKLFVNYPCKLSAKSQMFRKIMLHNQWLYRHLCKRNFLRKSLEQCTLVGFTGGDLGWMNSALVGFFRDMLKSKRGRWLFDLCNGFVFLITLPFRLIK